METDTAKKHDMIDTIVAVFLDETGKLPSNTTVMELMEWSDRKMKGFSNVKNPDYQTVKILLCQKIDQINKQGGTLQSTTTLSSALNQICKEYGGKRDRDRGRSFRAFLTGK